MSELENDSDQPASKSGKGWIFKAATWAVTLFCFYLVYTRTEATAAREGLTVVEYLLRFFSEADWTVWLMVMIPYSLFFQRRFSRHLASHTLVQCATTAIDPSTAHSGQRLHLVSSQRTGGQGRHVPLFGQAA